VAIEKELALTKYQTFSNLCKQALWQFLSVSVSESAVPTPSFQGLEQRIAELAVKFSEFEHNISTEELSRLEGLEHHLSQLSAQLSQLQGSVDGKVSFAQVSKVVEPNAVESKSVADNDVISDTETAPHGESDPLLDRLSSLLPQDF
jgi:TolA-binding protein